MNIFHENQVPWPAAKPITTDRKSGPFRTSMSDAAGRVEAEVGAFTKNGQGWRTKELWIYADADMGAKCRFLANQRGLKDPRVAVQFDLDGKAYKIVADRYIEPWQNLAGIAEYIKAIRAQERNGIFSAEEMMASFAALPTRQKWFRSAKTLADLKTQYRDLARKHHPDTGGDSAVMAEINAEFEQAEKSLDKGMEAK